MRNRRSYGEQEKACFRKVFGALIGVASALLVTAVAAAPLDNFFVGKQVRFVLGAAAGQDYDGWARLIGRHMPRYIPGNPNIIVENMPGGGHMIATNWLYNIASRDGTVWGMVSRNIPNQALLKTPGVRYDPLKFHWIGSPELTNRGCFAMARSSVKKAEDLFERELIVGGTGAGSSVTETPLLLRNLLGMKLKLVEGYVKPQDAVLAMETGELDGICQTVQSFNQTRPDWIKSGAARVLFTLEREPVPGVDAPTIHKFVKTDEQRRVMDFYSSSIELGRPVMLPPGVPPERVDGLRRAFDATLRDPQLQDEARRIGFDIALRTGEQIEGFIRDTMTTAPEIIAKASAMMQSGGR